MKRYFVVLFAFGVLATGCIGARMTCKSTKQPFGFEACAKSATLQDAFIRLKLDQSAPAVGEFSVRGPSLGSISVSGIRGGGPVPAYGSTPRILDLKVLDLATRNNGPTVGKHFLTVSVIGVDGKRAVLENLALTIKKSRKLCKDALGSVKLRVCYPEQAIPEEAYLEFHPSAPIISQRIHNKTLGIMSLRDQDLGIVNLPRAELEKIDKLMVKPFRVDIMTIFSSGAYAALEKIDLEIEVRFANGGSAAIDGIVIRFR